MLLKITRFVSLSLMGLGTGVSFSHLLQWKRKAELPVEVFVRVQKYLYNAYGPTGAIIEPGELLSTLATLALLRKRRTPALLTSLALLTVLTKFSVWALFIRPITGRCWVGQRSPFRQIGRSCGTAGTGFTCCASCSRQSGRAPCSRARSPTRQLRVGRAGVANRSV
jgi:hypothetical protein